MRGYVHSKNNFMKDVAFESGILKNCKRKNSIHNQRYNDRVKTHFQEMETKFPGISKIAD